MEQTHRTRFVRRVALLCAWLALLVVASSAYLRLHKAGVGCTPWPACHTAAAMASHTEGSSTAVDGFTAGARLLHRIAAVLMLLAALLIVASAWGPGAVQAQDKALGVSLLGVVVGLAVLGVFSAGSHGIGVALGNLLGGFLMLALSAALAFAPRPRSHAALAAVVGVLMLAQVVTGGLSSVTQAAWHPAEAALALPLHVGGGVLLAVVAGAMAWRARSERPLDAALLGLLLVAQLAVGLLLWLRQLDLPLGLPWVHNLGGALLVWGMVRLVRSH
ncbi:MAG: hypothetical protein ACOZJZ_04415 [Pseudomonadota bacterium]